MTTPSTEQPPPEQEQAYPGRTAEMDPHPRDEMRDYEGRGLLAGRRALITGGDSGIGGPLRWPSPRKARTWRSRTFPSRRTRTPPAPPNWSARRDGAA